MKVLVVTDLTELNTGLGIYGRNLLSLLNNNGHEVCEFGMGITSRYVEREWPIIYNQPSEGEEKLYESNPNNVNGQWKFEKVCLTFKQDVVIDIRDPFSYAYQAVSPYRKIFSWFNFAPVDGIPQKRQWIDLFKNADATFVYTKWGQDILSEYGITSFLAPPSADKEFCKKDKDKYKERFGLCGKTIVGSIKRNQPRKHIPELMEGFRYYLDQTNDTNTLLYLHTHYPDIGWNIPELIIRFGLSNKVLLTYICKKCDHIFPSFYRGLRSFCPECKQLGVRTVGVGDDLSSEVLSDIISCFDGYIQLAGREGFGMPQLEAALCGKPVISINYSGMGDFIKKYQTLGIEPDCLKFTHDMKMYDAYVKPETVSKAIEELLKSEPVSISNSTWEKNLQVILDKVNDAPKADWSSDIDIKPIPEYSNIRCSNYDYAKYLITHVLQRPEYLSSLMFTRLVDDLNNGYTSGNYYGTYLLENTAYPSQDFDRESAYRYIASERKRINFWESERSKL